MPVPKPSPPTAASPRHRVLIVDDHPVLRRGLKALLQDHARFEDCRDADTPENALTLLREWKPTLAVVDVSIGDSCGLELIAKMKSIQPELQVLVVSMHDESIYAEKAIRAGARGYLMKEEALDRIVSALDRIVLGDVYLTDRMKRKMLLRSMARGADSGAVAPDALSERETQVLTMLGTGFSTRAVADKLGLSIKTVDSYRENLKVKTGVASGAELVRYAVQWVRMNERRQPLP